MDINSKVEAAKVRGLMERMENKEHSLTEARELEKRLINEAKNRVQVTRDNILDILDQQDKENPGQYAVITYITIEDIYKTKRAGTWRPDDVSAMLDSTREEHGSSGWHQRVSAYNDPSVKSSTKNPVGAVIKVSNIRVNWTNSENYAKAYGEYNTELGNLRMRNGIAINTNGVLGDSRKVKNDTGFNGLYADDSGRIKKDFNFNSAKYLKSTYYVIDENGHIESEIPESAVKAMTSLPKSEKPFSNVWAGEREYLEDPDVLAAFSKAKKELDKIYKGRDIIMDNVLCITGTAGDKAYYYINDAIQNILTAKANVPVNSGELMKIAEEQLDVCFNGIQGFATEE